MAETEYVKRMTGMILRGEDPGVALVVNEPIEPLDALVRIVQEGYGGDWSTENPVLVDAAREVKVEVWRSCTKAWREGENVDLYADSWWSPNGDGGRSLLVAWYPHDVYDLGERAHAREQGEGDS